jgi:hypothetical protein
MIDLSQLPIDKDGGVPGIWRITARDYRNDGLPGANFVNGVAVGVTGPALRHLVAAMGHELTSITRTDVVETPLIPEPVEVDDDPTPQPNAAPAKRAKGRK